ncbi:MAG: SRPBCC family protein [Rhodospirillales bacterium]|nr:SRPBCC domain-containing protein [Rhodospirillales bacterium]
MQTTPARHPNILIRVARVIGAPQEEVYRAWTDPAGKPAWWGGTERGQLTACEMDVRVGGRFRYEMRLPGADAPQVATGEHLEVSPPARLVFTWPALPDAEEDGETKVTLEFVDLRDGTTRGVATHEGVSDQRVATIYRSGWANLLQDLARHFAGPR